VERVERVTDENRYCEMSNRVLKVRTVPLAVGTAFVAVGLAYSFFWAPLVQHHQNWITPPDLWETYRAAHYIGWGDVGDIYNSGSGLVTFPGIALVLAPVAELTWLLKMVDSTSTFLARPTSWLILGPVVMVIGATFLLPVDTLARSIGLRAHRRILLSLGEAILLWQVLVRWGHPEDVLAMAFALVAIGRVHDEHWRSAGWCFGLAMLFQPLVLLMAPILLAGAIPPKQWLRFTLRTVLPSTVFLVIPLLRAWGPTTQALIKQPNFPAVDHPTPFLHFAPVLQAAHWVNITKVVGFETQGVRKVVHGQTYQYFGPIVAAGPDRLTAIACALGIGFWLHKRRPNLQQLLWWCGVALALRCFFEAVMDPYYVFPPLAVFLLVAAMRSTPRVVIATALGVGLLIFTEQFHGPWLWWGVVNALLAASAITAWPKGSYRHSVVQPQETGQIRQQEGGDRIKAVGQSSLLSHGVDETLRHLI
jgi:hypothetical protein